MADYDSLSKRHTDLFRELTPRVLDRIQWSAEEIRTHQQRELRKLLAMAKDKSPWHRKRLAGIDPRTFTLDDLARIPPMTKEDMMANLDEILTDSRLSRQTLEAHVAGLRDDAYLLDEFHVVASGGSSGTRGIFVFGWEAWATAPITFMRFRMQYQVDNPDIGENAKRVTVAAGKATHMSYAIPRTFRAVMQSTPVPATLPLTEIVARLNDLLPTVLTGYPSSLYVLAREASAGRLRISPRILQGNSEPLLPEMRKAMQEAWGCPIFNCYGTSEGVAACGCGVGRGMHLAEDTAIFEFVDATGRPVPRGERAHKMYVTNLFNHVQPLIRYELTDEVIVLTEPCECGCAMTRIDDVEGRTDDIFQYDDVVVHPLVFRSRLGGNPNITEYQVRQTEHGADISVRTIGAVDAAALARAIGDDLERAGLAGAKVAIAVVDSFDRQQTGKLRRFFPLPSNVI
jgi:phenylacetate-coenzyme A ligase PaaK-like adenylate-forming protein